MMSKDYSFCFQTHTHRKYYTLAATARHYYSSANTKSIFLLTQMKKKIEKKTHFFNNIFLCARTLPGRYFRDDSMQ